MFSTRVEPAETGMRLDRVLASRAFLPTRSRVAALVRSGLVRVDGVPRKASFAVTPGEAIEVEVPPEPPSWVEPEAIEIRILHEDASIVAVDKPAGMATHPAPGTRTGTLVAALLHRWSMGGDWPDPQRPGIVHRLDKDTTGVIVVAKTPRAMHALARQFAARTVEKEYVAIVRGAPREDHGTVDLAIGRDPVSRHRMQARVGQRRPAVTEWRVLERFGDPPVASLVQATPRTGRTHQIRVHLASIGHPIVGDTLYAGESRAPSAGLRHALDDFPRQALHARRLRLRHPDDGREVEFEAPLPADMEALLARLRAPSPERRA
ncbi:MAG: RluA family pseudouridine synthase [Alphaproteobacteria bacterium]